MNQRIMKSISSSTMLLSSILFYTISGTDISFERVSARTETWNLEITGCQGTESHITNCDMAGWKQAPCPGSGEVISVNCGTTVGMCNCI